MWVDARPEMRCAVEAGAVDRTRLPCNLSCVMRDAAIASVFIDRIERETKEETCGGPRSSGYTSRGIRKCLDSQFSSTVFYSHLVSTFPKWTAYASVETRGEICLRKNRSRNSETCRPRSSPYVPLSVYYEKYIVTLCSSLSRDDESRPGRTQLILSDGYGPRPASSAHSAFVFLQRGVQKLVSNPTNIQSAVMWGGAIGCGALWLTQPFDYIKSVLTSKPDADQ